MVINVDDPRPPALSPFALELVERGRKYRRGDDLVLREPVKAVPWQARFEARQPAALIRYSGQVGRMVSVR